MLFFYFRSFLYIPWSRILYVDLAGFRLRDSLTSASGALRAKLYTITSGSFNGKTYISGAAAYM